MQQNEVRPTRLFASLALATALLTIGLIVFGAVVRVTDSGLGCGNHWPLCNGTIFPPLDNLTAWIEWLHRLFAALIGLFGLATLAVAFRAYRKSQRYVLTATAVAAGLFFVQSMLGAIVVVFDLPPTFVTLHLGTAMLLLGALLVATVSAMYQPKITYKPDSFSTLLYTTTALSLVIILTGALVRGSGATLSCYTWPLCNGELFPLNQGQLPMIHMLHRVAVLGLGLTLGLLVWYAYTNREHGLLRGLSIAALVVFLSQAGIGAMYVLSGAAPFWGASHVLFAALTWALLVWMCIIETLNSREIGIQWQQQSEPALN